MSKTTKIAHEVRESTWNAIDSKFSISCYRKVAAAAIRTMVEQTLPEEKEAPGPDCPVLGFWGGAWEQRQLLRAEYLSVADELEKNL
jgi:hypothetical protein